MLKSIITVVCSTVFSVAVLLLLLPQLRNPGGGAREIDAKREDGGDVQLQLKQQQERVVEMVIKDIEKYGPDIYRLYLEISRSNDQIPGSDFSADKSFKKLAVTYPDSNVYKLSAAWNYNKSLRYRDILQIEKAISESPADGSTRLMPNGFELEPLLYMAMFNYLQHTRRNEAAEKMMLELETKYSNSLLEEGRQIVRVKDWVAQQKKIRAAAEKFKKDKHL